jgi:TetR/AcrR family transcriptional regulator
MQSAARERIRKAAISLFSKKGFAAATTREICEHARVTKPILYYHFKNKQRLYRDLLLDARNESREQLLRATQSEGTAREKLIDFMAADFALTMREPNLSMMFLRMVFPSGEQKCGIDCAQMGMDRAHLIARIVADGICRGELRGQAQEVARALMGISLVYSMSYVLTGSPKLDRNLARRVVGLLIDGCGNTPAGR